MSSVTSCKDCRETNLLAVGVTLGASHRADGLRSWEVKHMHVVEFSITRLDKFHIEYSG